MLVPPCKRSLAEPCGHSRASFDQNYLEIYD
jgi:hypothetical protein